jgi:catechol 2,3-dioxygenase-like lactoylglutathione lyase family enzyme
MQVEQVDFVTVPTRDTQRAVAFYRDVLGPPESDSNQAEVETPNVTLSFWEPETQGVEFIGDTFDSSVCHMGFFKDPDGNVVILHRRYAPRTPG